LLAKLKQRAAALKTDAYALFIAARDPRVPWYAKAFMGLVLAYAFSPVDLIPDFIPVLGYLDDLLIVPLGIALVLKMIPAEVLIDARLKVEELSQRGEPVIRGGAVIMVIVWLVILALVAWFLVGLIMKKNFFALP
jgi:uncharacterized membrane protein YkvA (DUF1232 family)